MKGKTGLLATEDPNVHDLLIPFPIFASERRVLTFLHCARSDARKADQEVTVFVSVSGPSDFRTVVSGTARNCRHQWQQKSALGSALAPAGFGP